MDLKPVIDRLEALEPSLRSMEALFTCGLIIHGKVADQAGDWDLCIWSHSLDGSFTVGAMENTRKDGKPFPSHTHDQRAWLLCCKGRAKVVFEETGGSKGLNEGEYMVVPAKAPHSIHAMAERCVLVLVTIPADPGMKHDGDSEKDS